MGFLTRRKDKAKAVEPPTEDYESLTSDIGTAPVVEEVESEGEKDDRIKQLERELSEIRSKTEVLENPNNNVVELAPSQEYVEQPPVQQEIRTPVQPEVHQTQQSNLRLPQVQSQVKKEERKPSISEVLEVHNQYLEYILKEIEKIKYNLKLL